MKKTIAIVLMTLAAPATANARDCYYAGVSDYNACERENELERRIAESERQQEERIKELERKQEERLTQLREEQDRARIDAWYDAQRAAQIYGGR